MKYRLRDIGKIVGGGTPSTKHKEYFTTHEIPWITPKDLRGFQNIYISKGSRDITKLGYNNSSAKLMPKGTVLISSRAPIGYVAVAHNAVTTNQGFKSIIPNTRIITSLFLYYLIYSNVSKLRTYATGSTFKELSGRELGQIKFNIPSLERQNKITYILSSFDKKITLNKQINKNLIKLIKNIYLKFSKIREPKMTTINDISNGQIITGKTPSTKNESNYGNYVPFIRIPNMHHKIFTINTTKELSQKGANSQEKKFLPPFSLSVSCIGTPGLVTINAIKSQTNQQINSIIIDKKYLWILYIELSLMRTKIKRLGSGGTTISNMNKTSFSKMKVNIFNDRDLVKFNSLASPSFYLILHNQEQNMTLNKLKKSLLLKFFN